MGRYCGRAPYWCIDCNPDECPCQCHEKDGNNA